MNKTDVEAFEKLMAQLSSIHSELSMLSKKSPNDALNKFKIKFVNTVLKGCNLMFGDKYKPFEDFSEFSEDDMPSNSDAILIISQYMEAAELLRVDNISSRRGSAWHWVIEGEAKERPTVKTTMPKKFRK